MNKSRTFTFKKSKRYVSMELMGGLGNQMFQYAAGRAFALRHKVPLYLDKSWCEPKHAPSGRLYGLDAFRIQALDWEQRTSLWYRFIKRVYRRVRRYPSCKPLLSVLNAFLRVCCGVTFYDAKTYQQKDFESLRPTVFFVHSYWQCERFFKPVADTIHQEFDLTHLASPRTQPLLEKIRQPNTVSLHVRKGDYSAVAQLPLAYYEKAVQRIRQQVANPHFFVFSDEIASAKVMLKGLLPQATYVSDPRYSRHEEMLLMSQCAHHIMANSTFSWWAAWLSVPHPDRHVFAPYLWHSYGKLAHVRDIYCEGWVLL